MKKFVSLLLSTALTLSANARIWTRPDGKTVDAEIVKVNPNQTVTLRTRRGKTVTVPFNTFVEADMKHLEELLIRGKRGALHAVPWNELNELFGTEIWKDEYLWDDPTAETAERMKLHKESKTDFMENHRAYPRGEAKILGEAVYAAALYGGPEHVDGLSFVFLNLGDVSLPPAVAPDDLERILDQIEECGGRASERLSAKLGEPKRDSLGKGDTREKVWRWDWNGHAIMLSLQEGKYSALRVMPVERADRSGRGAKITEGELKKRMAACVERRANGDVVIRNVPMIDQGPKGYCSPATWERYLRFMDIPADMYLLALAGDTGIGGGTSSSAMMAATKSLISANGRELKEIDGSMDLEDLAEYIDQGLPIMWRFISTPAFQRAANNATAVRRGEEITEHNNSGQAEDTGSGGHICLIIGYNERTNEIAISDSWGARFAERWVPVSEAENASYGAMNVIKW